jgi:hypothetical protein
MAPLGEVSQLARQQAAIGSWHLVISSHNTAGSTAGVFRQKKAG